MTNTQAHTTDPRSIPGVENTLVVASGKGGVGKSTLSANLAVAMARSGLRVGLMDADIYGPNIPGMLGIADRPTITETDGLLVPLESSGVKLVSMGCFLDPGTPVIWRGPMLTKAVDQFLFQVAWGELDVLVLDLPPGTGDVQITLTQSVSLTGALIVTTPSDIALEDVRRSVRMFREVEVPIFGLIENMSSFVCHQCGHRATIFGEGGGRRTAEKYDVPFLGEVPLDSRLRECADLGTPIVDAEPDSPTSRALSALADTLLKCMAAS